MRIFKSSITVLLVAILSSCMSTTSLEVMRPADVVLPNGVHDLGIIQRNEAAKGDKMGKRVEGFLTGEGIGTDKRSAVYVVNGLVLELSKSPIYNIKQANHSEKLYGTGKLMMAKQLDWDLVQQICDNNGVDALIVVEGFDSDVSKDRDFRDVEKERDGSTITERTYSITKHVDTDVNWRIYYPKTKEIIDTHHDNVDTSEKRSGTSESGAEDKLPSTERMVKRGAEQLGVRYARRISPTKVRVQRRYYSGGSTRMTSAKQKFLVKDYDGAIDLWDQEYRLTFKNKLKRRAAYNLALAHEAKGDFEKALYWAGLSRSAGDKRANAYYSSLQTRQMNDQRLKEQLEERK